MFMVINKDKVVSYLISLSTVAILNIIKHCGYAIYIFFYDK